MNLTFEGGMVSEMTERSFVESTEYDMQNDDNDFNVSNDYNYENDNDSFNHENSDNYDDNSRVVCMMNNTPENISSKPLPSTVECHSYTSMDMDDGLSNRGGKSSPMEMNTSTCALCELTDVTEVSVAGDEGNSTLPVPSPLLEDRVPMEEHDVCEERAPMVEHVDCEERAPMVEDDACEAKEECTDVSPLMTSPSATIFPSSDINGGFQMPIGSLGRRIIVITVRPPRPPPPKSIPIPLILDGISDSDGMPASEKATSNILEDSTKDDDDSSHHSNMSTVLAYDADVTFITLDRQPTPNSAEHDATRRKRRRPAKLQEYVHFAEDLETSKSKRSSISHRNLQEKVTPIAEKIETEVSIAQLREAQLQAQVAEDRRKEAEIAAIKRRKAVELGNKKFQIEIKKEITHRSYLWTSQNMLQYPFDDSREVKPVNDISASDQSTQTQSRFKRRACDACSAVFRCVDNFWPWVLRALPQPQPPVILSTYDATRNFNMNENVAEKQQYLQKPEEHLFSSPTTAHYLCHTSFPTTTTGASMTTSSFTNNTDNIVVDASEPLITPVTSLYTANVAYPSDHGLFVYKRTSHESQFQEFVGGTATCPPATVSFGLPYATLSSSFAPVADHDSVLNETVNRHSGRDVVAIASIQSSCSCTVASNYTSCLYDGNALQRDRSDAREDQQPKISLAEYAEPQQRAPLHSSHDSSSAHSPAGDNIRVQALNEPVSRINNYAHYPDYHPPLNASMNRVIKQEQNHGVSISHDQVKSQNVMVQSVGTYDSYELPKSNHQSSDNVNQNNYQFYYCQWPPRRIS